MAREKDATVATVIPQQLDAPAVQSATTSYHIGLTSNCPYEHMTVGGVTFHVRTEDVAEKADAAGITQRVPRQGQVVNLDADTITRVKNAAMRRVIRMASRRPTRYDIADPRYRRDASDVPVGKFMYMVPVAVADGAFIPPPIL